MTAGRTNAKFYLENKKPLNDYDRAIRAIKPTIPIYLDNCLAYVNNKDYPLEVKKIVIKRLKSNTCNLFNDIYPKLDKMLTQAAIEVSSKKSGIVKKLKSSDVTQTQVSADDMDSIYESLQVDPQAEALQPDEEPVNEGELKADPQEELVDPETAQQKELEQQNAAMENF
jgi:hypothetical protein